MKSVSRLHFAHLDTPIEPMPRLSALLGGPRLFVKRDDQTGLAFGGNKTRKLEFLGGDAQALGAETLITGGAMQSNHCRQTAALGAKLGMRCILVLSGTPDERPSANLALNLLFGAEIVWVEKREERDAVLQSTFETAKASGQKPYLVPYGGSSPVGALGYAFAMEEFQRQQCPADWIVFGTSSGGTQAGLVLGQRLFGYKGKVLGISIDEPEAALKRNVSQLATEAAALLGESITFGEDDVLVNDTYCHAGYGVLTEGEKESVRLFARQEGLLLDPVYTGRAAAGMIDLIRRGFFKKEETVLFWNTGGQPAIFADKYQAGLLS